MNVASPGFFTNNAKGSGQIAALNCNQSPCDNTRNSLTSMALVDSTIQLFGTGQGVVPGAPPDGEPAKGAVSTQTTPTVYIGGPPAATVTYSGLAPGLVGVWQINVKIPHAPVAFGNFPTNVFPVLVVYDGLPSNPAQNNSNPALATTIAIKAQ